MKIQASFISIAEIRDMIGRKDLVVNREYQRSAGLWPQSAKSYFIDTILNEFPFPKVYFYEAIERRSKKIVREIVDGQQRVTTILEFLDNKLRLANSSRKFQGMRFDDLEEDVQMRFLGYSVPVDMILSAERPEILEMFRRMNAFTLPLNSAEKRHSGNHGKFKWFINELADSYSPMFSEFGVLTRRQIVRMADAELLTELAVVIAEGIVNKSEASLNKIYRENDKEFVDQEELGGKIEEVLAFIRESLGEFANSYLMRSYVVHSLACSLLQNKYGIPNGNLVFEFEPAGSFVNDLETTKNQLHALASAHENKEEAGPYGEYVRACMSTTHRIAQRRTRSRWLLLAMRGELEPR